MGARIIFELLISEKNKCFFCLPRALDHVRYAWHSVYWEEKTRAFRAAIHMESGGLPWKNGKNEPILANLWAYIWCRDVWNWAKYSAGNQLLSWLEVDRGTVQCHLSLHNSNDCRQHDSDLSTELTSVHRLNVFTRQRYAHWFPFALCSVAVHWDTWFPTV